MEESRCVTVNKRKKGADYEEAAADFLIRSGYRILEHNYRSRYGEIDLIAREEKTLVFVEVKYRKTDQCGDPLEAVGFRKQLRICRVADRYLMQKRYPTDTPCRFDAVAILGDRIRLVRNAFPYIPAGYPKQ